jgi:phenylalanyl-tRNA synthetase beta chain
LPSKGNRNLAIFNKGLLLARLARGPLFLYLEARNNLKDAMKLSIAWIFDHLDASWKDHASSDLAHKLTMTTAEIERFVPVSIDLDRFTAAIVTDLEAETVTVFSAEWDKEFSLPRRSDAHESKVFLITKDSWVTMVDMGGTKEGLFPAVELIEKDMAGGWKDSFEHEDFLLELDNVAVTHRPDLWSHRGFAREISAITGIPLKPINHFLTKRPVVTAERAVASSPKHTVSLEVDAVEAVPHFAGLYINSIENGDCLLRMAHRLARIDAKPIAAIVDATNYVMFDIGQPLNAYDLAAVKAKKLTVRKARAGEKLSLRAGAELNLLPTDVVIADEIQPRTLAGITGDATTMVTDGTESIFLESASFDAKIVRASSTRLKIRSESSARFEKGVSPYNNVVGIERFLKLLDESELAMTVTDDIVALGKLPAQHTVSLEHEMLQARMGMTVTPEAVRSALQRLEFKVAEHNGTYEVTVPVFRLKDVNLAEDLVEEVVRIVGYKNIVPQLPAMTVKPHDLRPTLTLRKIKQHFSIACAMHELATYSLFDEPFLQKLGIQKLSAVPLLNPVSEHYQSLVTSLVPNMLKAVVANEHKQDQLRFFEWARVWNLDTKQPSGTHEKKSLVGIFFDRKKPVNFYEVKAYFEQLFTLLDMTVEWRKVSSVADKPWFNLHETAQLFNGDTLIGTVGMVDTALLARVAHGHACAFELDGDALLAWLPHLAKFAPLQKYPAVWLDISVLVPVATTVDQVQKGIAAADAKIVSVSLVDFFEKPEWVDKRSLTLRYVAQDSEKTLEKAEIEAIEQAVSAAVKKMGATIR